MIADEDTLARLMIASQDGDSEAYDTLLTVTESLLRRYFRNRIVEHAVDDLIQETLISLHTKRATWDRRRAFLPWLTVIARYRWVDHLRRHYRAAESAIDETIGVESGEAAIVARFGCEQLLKQLPPTQAAAIRKTRIEGLSIIEAAAALGQSESLIKVNVHRGLKRLSLLVEAETL